jgi:hypothetical protein
MAASVPRQRRAALSVLLGLVAGAVTWQANVVKPWPRDFEQVWFAARSIVAGVNPYPLVGPGLAFDWPWPLLYPIPAALVATPLVPLPASWASVVFMVIGGAAFAWALMEHGYGPLFGFFGAALHDAAEVAQWSPLFAASVVVPSISALFLAKPTIGAAMFVARPSWWAVGGALVLALIAFGVQPTWIGDWLNAVRANRAAWLPYHPYQFPVAVPGGWLSLLCLLRWRRPEARLVAALACVPQTPMLYETVALFLVPRSFWEATALLALSYGQHAILQQLLPPPQLAGEYLEVGGRLIAVMLYIPATVMVLRRANVGAVPQWIESRIPRSWPHWLRGSP